MTRGEGRAMWLVRLGTFSRYGHAAVCIAVAPGVTIDSPAQVLIVEAMPSGARTRWCSPGEFLWSTHVELTVQQRQTICRRARSCVGVPYDWLAILGFVARFWGVKLRGRSGDHSDDRLICSELVVWCYAEAGRFLFPGIAPGDVSPGDLADLLIPR